MPSLKVKDDSGRWVGVFCGAGKTVAVDTNLTQSGQAADAKVVGDKFAQLAIESTEYPGCYYRLVDGIQEWINPPMLLGTPYRTSERFNGRAVYICTVAIPLLSQNEADVIDISSIVSGMPQIVDIQGTISENGSDCKVLPFYSSDSYWCRATIDWGDGGLIVEHNGFDDCPGYVTFKFVQDT